MNLRNFLNVQKKITILALTDEMSGIKFAITSMSNL